MGADSLPENAYLRIYLLDLSAKAQKFWILMKKDFIGRP